MVDGIVRLSLTDAGDFVRVFVPAKNLGRSEGLSSKYESQIEQELIDVFGLSPSAARRFIENVKKTRDAEWPATVSDELAAKLVDMADATYRGEVAEYEATVARCGQNWSLTVLDTKIRGLRELPRDSNVYMKMFNTPDAAKEYASNFVSAQSPGGPLVWKTV